MGANGIRKYYPHVLNTNVVPVSSISTVLARGTCAYVKPLNELGALVMTAHNLGDQLRIRVGSVKKGLVDSDPAFGGRDPAHGRRVVQEPALVAGCKTACNSLRNLEFLPQRDGHERDRVLDRHRERKPRCLRQTRPVDCDHFAARIEKGAAG